MKALVLWGNEASTNLGVRALGAGCEAILRWIDPRAEISHQGYGPGDAPVRIGSYRSQARRLVRDTDGLIDWVRGFDLVLDTRAGDSFADIYGLDRLLTMNLMAAVVHRARVPIVYTPQTIGPFNTRRGSVLAWRALRTADVVIARDRRSADVSAALRRPADLVSTDVVFALDQQNVAKTRDVLLNVSGLLWKPNPHVDYKRYRSLMIELSRRLIVAGRNLTLLAHVIDSPDPDNDVPACRELSDRLSAEGVGQPDILVPTSLSNVRSEIASGRVVVGARMHACLNALSLGVPAVPLPYSRKFAPLMEQIGGPAGVDLRTENPAMADDVISAVDADDLEAKAVAVRDRAHTLLAPVRPALERALQ